MFSVKSNIFLNLPLHPFWKIQFTGKLIFFYQICFLGSALERLYLYLNEGFVFSNDFPCVMACVLSALGQLMLLLGPHFSWGPLAPSMEILVSWGDP